MLKDLGLIIGSCVMLYICSLEWLHCLFDIDTTHWGGEPGIVKLDVWTFSGLSFLTCLSGYGFASTVVIPIWKHLKHSSDSDEEI